MFYQQIIKCVVVLALLCLTACNDDIEEEFGDFRNFKEVDSDYDFDKLDAFIDKKCNQKFSETLDTIGRLSKESPDLGFEYPKAVRDEYVATGALCLDMIEEFVRGTSKKFNGLASDSRCMTTINKAEEIIGNLRVMLKDLEENPLKEPEDKTKAFKETGAFSVSIPTLNGLAKMNYTLFCPLGT